jgi:hypothetical protein
MKLSELIKEAQKFLDMYGDREVRLYPSAETVTNMFISADDLDKEAHAYGKAPVHIEANEDY